jgi:formylglycine-generating enzyme required for sulfatase activity
LAIIGIPGLLLLATIAIGGAYALGLFGAKNGNDINVANIQKQTPEATPTIVPPVKAEMVKITGGDFQMGRDDGRENEKPAHPVTVNDFWMDKTEVTNAEYHAFTSETGYKPHPAHWVNERPIAGEEKMPVRFVNIDDVKAFAEWRSKRDSATYRLPTEEEWEYAARNGAKNNLYPWGDKFDAKCAVVDEAGTEPKSSGSNSCPNQWGVHDLIGNVYEWTGSKAYLYPGSKGVMAAPKVPRQMIRGGAALNKSSGDFAISSTFRADVEITKRDKELGFRLVRSD